MIISPSRLGRTILCLLLASTFLIAGPAYGQRTPQDVDQEAQWLKDFVHYVLVARVDLAHSSAQALLDSPIADADLYVLIDELDISTRLEDALVRAARIAELEEVAGRLQRRINSGRIDLARDPDEIERHINNLVGSARGRRLAEQALEAAGEYAVPQLLDVLTGSNPADLKARVYAVLISIGRQAVTPLATALPALDPVSQERVANILGEIGHPHALPAIATVRQNPRSTPAVRTATARAFDRLNGPERARPADLWLGLAEEYWRKSDALIAWPDEGINNVWRYESGPGLIPVAVPTEIFFDVMAMRCAEDSLRAQPNSLPALSMWIAANFRRADELGEMTDPTYGADRRRPLYYAVAAGPTANQLIVRRALNDGNSRLARHAIRALDGTAGGSSLWVATDGPEAQPRPTPLIDALTFPERRVRYDAALALARALPTESFDGADRVAPILAQAVRASHEPQAAVIADHEETQRSIAANLRQIGFDVIPPRSSYQAMREDLAEVPGIDLFVVRIPVEQLIPTVEQIQQDLRLAATPILIITAAPDVPRVRTMFDRDHRISVVRTGLDLPQTEESIRRLVRRTTGELMTAEEADTYAVAALTALRDIAVRDTVVYDLTVAEGALIEALDTFSGQLRLTAAQTLAWVPTRRAQRALLDAALNEPDEAMRIALLDHVAHSARRHGSHADQRQVREVVELVRTSFGPLATAAAQAHGALNLPASNTVPLILGE